MSVVGDVDQDVDGHLVLAGEVPLAADVVLEGALAVVAHLDTRLPDGKI